MKRGRPNTGLKIHVFSVARSQYWYAWWREKGIDGEEKRMQGVTQYLKDDYTQEWVERELNKKLGGEKKPVAQAVYTVKWVKRYIEDALVLEGKPDSTWKDFILPALNKFAKVWGDRDVREFNKHDIDNLKQYMLNNGCKPVSVNTYCRAMQSVYMRLIKKGIVEQNPFDRFERIQIHAQDKLALTAEEARNLLSKLAESPESVRSRLIRLLLYTGIRRTELLRIEKQDIDIEKMRMKVLNIKSRDKHKRWIHILPQAREDISWFLGKYPDKDRPFEICHPDTLTGWIKDTFETMNLNSALHLHSLRHTFATLALEGGMSIRALQRHLDHYDVRTTEIYAYDTSLSYDPPDFPI